MRRVQLSWLTCIAAYRIAHAFRMRVALIVVIFCHLSLAIFEPPSNMNFQVATYVCSSLELLFLCIYAADTWLRMYCHDTYTLRFPWVRAKILVIGLLAIEAVVSMAVAASGSQPVRVLRVLRPFFLFDKGRSMKRTASNVLSVIPKISEVALLLCTHIFFSGVIGYVLFSRKAIGIGKNPNFESLESSFYSLFILLTTTNFPDVMIPSYNAQNWTALFFVAYLVFGLFFLMNLVLAVVVSSFKRSTREVCEEVIKNQCSALAAAFNELADSTPHTPDKVVTAESWMSMMRFYRPGVSDRHSLVIFRALDVHGNCYLTLSEWRRIPEFVDVKIVGDTDLQDQILFERKLRSMSGSKIFLAVSFRKLQAFLLHPFAETFFDLVVLANAIAVVVQIETGVHEGVDVSSKRIVNRLFLAFFLLEMMSKLVVFGLRKYLRNWINAIDLVVVTLSLMGESTSRIPWSADITLFRLFRIFRPLYAMQRFRIMFNTLREIIPATLALMGVLLTLFYVFAIAGMWFFEGAIVRDLHATQGSPVSATTYALSNYWELNFNDMAHSVVTLFALLIVNNWFIIMDGFVAATANRWSRLYFVAFYFCAAIVAMQVLLAFLLEAFLAQHSKQVLREEAQFSQHIRKAATHLRQLVTALHPGASKALESSLASIYAQVANEESSDPRAGSLEMDVAPRQAVDRLLHGAGRREPPIGKLYHMDSVLDLRIPLDDAKTDGGSVSAAEPATPEVLAGYDGATQWMRTVRLHADDLELVVLDVASWIISRSRRTPHLYLSMFERELGEHEIQEIRTQWVRSDSVASQSH